MRRRSRRRRRTRRARAARGRQRALLANQIHEVAQRKANERSLSVSQGELKYNKRLMVEAGVLV